MTWTVLRVEVLETRDEASAALFAAGAQGVHEDGAALITHFPPGTDIDAVIATVAAAAPGARCSHAEAPDVDWSVAWKDKLVAHTLGALTVSPPWLAARFDTATMIVVDPGMAFGTGDHPTTRGVVRLMQGIVRAGDVVADLGAGSAVLAIAAAKLGAGRVTAIEMDLDSIGNAEENVITNGVGGVVHVVEGDALHLLPLVAPVRVVLANIISSVLVELLPVIQRALTDDGRAILSGILFEERASMLAVLGADGWRVEAEDREETWWSVVIARP